MMSSESTYETLLMRVAEKYAHVIDEWKADRVNPFKDGRMLGYYEGKSLILNELDKGRPLTELKEQLRTRLQIAKAEWRGDRANRFKDGRLLAWFELSGMLEDALAI